MEKTALSATEALSRAHTALREDLRRLDETVRRAAADDCPSVRACLDATRAHITEHFRIEEENGYLGTVRKREPRLEHAIQQLVEEHRQLTRSLQALIATANADATVDEAFRTEVRKWIDHIRRHEKRENDLVQEAFNLDIGPED
jgi:hemerythrin-like domain-containing protein